ncbi:hypothetical protein AGMMS4952_13830 [Spirochaetia bacterium]|nr:hypothetical protein AGMMS4952_13830 [Spirochaetia bacterium]
MKTMKKLTKSFGFLSLAAALAAVLALTGCPNDTTDTPTGPVLTSLAVTDLPTKTVYIVGESFESAGILVTGTYDDATTADVTDEVSYSGFDSSAAGENTVTVSIGSVSDTFTVSVLTRADYDAITAFSVDTDVVAALALTESGLEGKTRAELAAEKAKIDAALAVYNALSSTIQPAAAPQKAKLDSLSAKIEALVPTTLKMIQQEVGAGTGYWDNYYDGRLDIYPYIQSVEAGKAYKITVSGTAAVAMDKFKVSIRPYVWADFIDGSNSDISAGPFTHTEVIGIPTTQNFSFGQYFIQIANFGARENNAAQFAEATTITDFDLTVEEVPTSELKPSSTLPMIQQEAGDGTGDWDNYYDARFDIYPYIQTLESGKVYTITVTGDITVAMNKFTVSIRPYPWADYITGAQSGKSTGPFTHTQNTPAITETKDILPGQYFIQIANFNVSGAAKGATVTSITNFDLSIAEYVPVAATTLEMRKDGSSGSNWWDQSWRAETDLYPMVQGSFTTGTTYTITITGNTDTAMARFTHMIKLSSEWGELNSDLNTTANISAGAINFTRTFTLTSNVNITGPGQYNILLLNLGTDGDGVSPGATAATITNFTVTITP